MRLSLRRALLAAVGITAVIVISGLGFAQASRPAAAADGLVDIKSFRFTPNLRTINVGDTVTWSNQDGVPHTATSDAGVSPAFTTGRFNFGEVRSVTFNTAGVYTYFCEVHPNMKATLVVQGPDGLPTAPPAPPPATPSAEVCALTVADQAFAAGSRDVIIPLARQSKPGYVVIHEAGPTGGPGPVIGDLRIAVNADNRGAVVHVDRDLKNGETLWPMLHTEDNGNTRYDGVATDRPTVSSTCGNPATGGIVTFPMRIGVAPRPPATGSGLAEGSGSDGGMLLLASLGVLTIAGAAGAVALAKR